jgi:O-antigen/teichoic acid export membrane protein
MMAASGPKALLGRVFGSKLFSDAAWVMGLRLFRQFAALLLVAVLVRLMSKESFGEYQLAFTIVGALGFTTLPGIQRSIVQSVARGHEGTYTTGTRLNYRASFAGAAIMAAVAGWFWWHNEHSQALAVLAAAVLFPPSQGLTQWQFLQVGRRRYRANTIALSIGVIASSVAAIALAAFGFRDPWMIVAGVYGALAIQNIILQHNAARSIPADAEVEPGSIRYGLKSSFWEVLNGVANYADRLFVFSLGSAVDLAAYAVADRIPEQVKTNIQQFQTVLVPRFAARDAYTRELDAKLNRAGVIAAACILAFAFIALPFIFPLLYTDSYASSVIFCQLILVSMAIGAFAMLKNSFINARLDIRGQRNILAGSAVIRLASSALLVWWLGGLGAAISTILYRLSTVVLVEIHIRRHYLGVEAMP